MAKRGETWSDDETSALIAVWGNEEIQKKLTNSHKNSDIYKAISAKLKEKKGCERDWLQCRTKIKHLKVSYKKFKDKMSFSGEGRSKAPKYFEELDVFLGDQPEAHGLEKAIDTSAEDEDPAETDNDIEEEFKAKYGEGRIYQENCPRCGKEVDIQSAGVYAKETGSLRIYAEDELLQCPHCGFTQQDDDGKPENKDEDPREKSLEEQQAPEKKKKGKEKKPSKEPASKAEKAMASYTAYQKEADDKFLSFMKEQSKEEANIRMQECKAFCESITLLANAISSNSNTGITRGNFNHPPPTQEAKYEQHPIVEEDDNTYFSL